MNERKGIRYGEGDPRELDVMQRTPNKGATMYPAGSVGISRGKGFVDWGIRAAEKRRYGNQSPLAWGNHAFMNDGKGNVIEAQGRGVVLDPFSNEYDEHNCSVWMPNYVPFQDAKAVSYMTDLIGRKYGYLEIVSEGLAFLFGTKLRFGIEGQYICSGAVSHAISRTGIDMGDDSDWNSPADILKIASTQRWACIGGVQLLI